MLNARAMVFVKWVVVFAKKAFTDRLANSHLAMQKLNCLPGYVPVTEDVMLILRNVYVTLAFTESIVTERFARPIHLEGRVTEMENVLETTNASAMKALVDQDCKCPSTNDEVCSGHGKCEWLFGNHCKCDKFYSGPKCEKFNCRKAMKEKGAVECGGHGQCKSNFYNEYSCKCKDGFTGADCTTPALCPTDNNGLVCGGNGVCFKGKCQCADGFEGENCATKTCSRKCAELGFGCKNGVCDCPGNQYGSHCQCERKIYSPPLHPVAKIPLGYCFVGGSGKPICGSKVAQYFCNVMHPGKNVVALSVDAHGQNRRKVPESASFMVDDSKAPAHCPANHAFDSNVQCNALSYVICQICPEDNEDNNVKVHLDTFH